MLHNLIHACSGVSHGLTHNLLWVVEKKSSAGAALLLFRPPQVEGVAFAGFSFFSFGSTIFGFRGFSPLRGVYAR